MGRRVPGTDDRGADVTRTFSDRRLRFARSSRFPEAKEAALAAVLRYDRWLSVDGGETDELLTRESLAWWDD